MDKFIVICVIIFVCFIYYEFIKFRRAMKKLDAEFSKQLQMLKDEETHIKRHVKK